MSTKKELEEKISLLEEELADVNKELDEAEEWVYELIEENQKLEEECTVLDSEFNTLAEENILLKQVIANVFQGEEEELARFFTRLKREWTDEPL